MATSVEQMNPARREMIHAGRAPANVTPALVLGAILVGAALVWLLARPLALLVLAITIAEAVAPLVSWLERRMPRTVAAIAVFVAAGGALLLIGWLLYPRLSTEISDISRNYQTLMDRLGGALSVFGEIPGQHMMSALRDFGQMLTRASSALGQGALEAVAVIFLAIYLTVEGPAFRRFVAKTIPAGAGRMSRDRILGTLDEAGANMGGYVRGAVIDAVIVGALAWIGLELVGLQYAFLIGGVLSSLGELLPYLGPVVAGAAAVGVGLLDSQGTALAVLILYVAIQQIEGHIVTPLVMRSQTALPAGLVLFAFMTGTLVGGALGAVVSIPLAAALRVIVVRAVAPAVSDAYTARRGGRGGVITADTAS